MKYLSTYLTNIFYQGMEFFGKYYANYRGYVLDNDDPEKLNRLSVRVPQVTGNNAHTKWAYAKGNFSGDNYGVQVLPRKGDLVWIEFEHGNPSFPLWSHAHYSKGQKPKEFDSVNVFGFKSPNGQMIILDDNENRIYLSGGGDEVLGGNVGLVKVKELTERLNKIEDKINDWLTHYKGHVHIDPISGQTGVIVQPNMGAPSVLPQPFDIDKTDQAYIENKTVQH